MQIPLLVVNLEDNGYHLLVKARIDGVDTNLILDTGASNSLIDSKLAKRIGAVSVNQTMAYGFSSQNVEVQVVEIGQLEFEGGISYSHTTFAVADLSKFSQLYNQVCGYQVDGMLGSNFLIKHCSAINLKNRVMTLVGGRRTHQQKNK